MHTFPFNDQDIVYLSPLCLCLPPKYFSSIQLRHDEKPVFKVVARVYGNHIFSLQPFGDWDKRQYMYILLGRCGRYYILSCFLKVIVIKSRQVFFFFTFDHVLRWLRGHILSGDRAVLYNLPWIENCPVDYNCPVSSGSGWLLLPGLVLQFTGSDILYKE